MSELSFELNKCTVQLQSQQVIIEKSEKFTAKLEKKLIHQMGLTDQLKQDIDGLNEGLRTQQNEYQYLHKSFEEAKKDNAKKATEIKVYLWFFKITK